MQASADSHAPAAGASHKQPLRVCVIGLGGGGFHWEVERIIQAVARPLELVLIYAGPRGGLKYWKTSDKVIATHVVRSPSLTGDRGLRKALHVLVTVWQALAILIRHPIDVVLSVGTAQAVPFGIAARMTGTEMWHVESITRMRAPSRTAKLVARLGLASRLYYYSRDLKPHFPRGICIEDTPR